MADDENKTSWELDLDVKDALGNIDSLKDGLDHAFETESLEGLISTITTMGYTIGLVAAAILALKETFDLVFDAEQINAINQQFDVLTANAGLAGEDIKKGMEDASGGLINTTTLIQDANQAVLKLGASAEQLPEIMAVARQATAVMGGDLSTNFNNIVQAIASGHARMLAGMGIVIDQKKAYDDYAKSIGVAANELSKAGQQHAIMNAVLEKGKTAFEGIDPSVKEATNLWQELKTTFSEIGELAATTWNKVAGPAVRTVLSDLATGAKSVRLSLEQIFGTGDQAAEAKAEKLKMHLAELKKALTALQTGSHPIGDFLGIRPAAVKKLENEIKQTEEEIAKASEKTAQRQIASSKSVTRADEVDAEARKKHAQELNKKIEELRQKNMQDEIKDADSIAKADALAAKQKEEIEKKTAADIQKIKQQYKGQSDLVAKLEVEMEKKKAHDIQAIDDDMDKRRLAALRQYADENSKTAKAITATWRAETKASEQQLTDFTNLGKTSFNAFSSNASSAFMSIGDGSKSASDAMKGAMLGSIADIAQAQGALMIAASLYPPNPAVFAGGAALEILAGVLKSAAGSSGGSVSTMTTTPGGASPSFSTTTGTTSGNATVSPTNLQQQGPKQAVNVTIEGDYLNTSESQRALMDVIRGSQDVSDFNLFKVGGT